MAMHGDVPWEHLWPALRRLAARTGFTVSPLVETLTESDPAAALAALMFPHVEQRILNGLPPESARFTHGHRPYGLTAALREETAVAFATVAFGKNRVRRDLVRECAVAPLSALAVAAHVKTTVPVDHLVEYLRASHDAAPSTERYRAMRSVLLAVPATRRRRFLVESLTSPDARDSLVLAGDVAGPLTTPGVDTARNWSGLHDALTAEFNLRYARNELEREQSHREAMAKPIPQTPVAASVHGVRVGPHTVNAAHTVGEVIGWGQYMHNCIGSYAYRAARGDCILLAVTDDEQKIVANIELTPAGELAEINGRFNKPIARNLEGRIAAAIRAAAKQAA